MNLSDKEKELIIQAIKNNQSMPKEYLYKMHSDEEDVFLFWNGRKEDVTNVALPYRHFRVVAKQYIFNRCLCRRTKSAHKQLDITGKNTFGGGTSMGVGLACTMGLTGRQYHPAGPACEAEGSGCYSSRLSHTGCVVHPRGIHLPVDGGRTKYL